MRTVVAIVAGLAVGIALALGLAVAVYSLVPATAPPSAPATPAPSVAIATPSPSPSPTATDAASPAASRSPSPFPLVGQVAPPLVAPGLDGSSIDLAAYRGRPVWLVFGGTYCPPCRDEYPLMNGFAVRYEEAGLVVLAVHVKEGADVVEPFVEELGVTFPVALDEDGSRAATWDAVALPVHYWIDAEGVVQDAALGGLGPDQMAASLGTILPGVTFNE
jgi:cytochrome c biogenesis protein CcmG/thiol:disulfide interchange protein DsbE